MVKIVVFALAAAAAGAAHAQKSARPNPADPQAPAPEAQYRSAFSEYQPFREPEIEKWREVNDQMKELGGHKGHGAKPSEKPEPKPEVKPEAAPADPHVGHR
jgi:hypothetical protein